MPHLGEGGWVWRGCAASVGGNNLTCTNINGYILMFNVFFSEIIFKSIMFVSFCM